MKFAEREREIEMGIGNWESANHCSSTEISGQEVKYKMGRRRRWRSLMQAQEHDTNTTPYTMRAPIRELKPKRRARSGLDRWRERPPIQKTDDS